MTSTPTPGDGDERGQAFIDFSPTNTTNVSSGTTKTFDVGLTSGAPG